MILPVNTVDTLEDYERRREYLDKKVRPLVCPDCEKRHTFWRHGGYFRTVFEREKTVKVRINRFLCGQCGLVVSCIYSFLAPYLRFTSRIVAEATQNYAEVAISYIEQAADLTDLESEIPAKPSGTQVFRWIAQVAQSAEWLLFQLQKELVLRGKSDSLDGLTSVNSPNEKKAKTSEKRCALKRLSEFAQIARLATASGAAALHKTHALFLGNVESLQAIFTRRQLRLPTPHKVQYAPF